MNKDSAREAALRNGYTHVRTYAGPIRLQEWWPYGDAGASAQFEYRDGLLVDLPPERSYGDRPTSGQPAEMMLGVWVLDRYPNSPSHAAACPSLSGEPCNLLPGCLQDGS